MNKPPVIIEGEFREIAALPRKQPFWGENASVSNFFYALSLGCSMMAPDPASLSQPRWRRWIPPLILIGIIALGRIATGS